jgi:hypothetical protein
MPKELLPHESVLAIDPGNFNTAYCHLRGDKKILGFGKESNEAFILRLRFWVDSGVTPTVIAAEQIMSYGMAVGASVFDTCVVIGELKEICRKENWVQVGRLEVKLAICKSPKANDANIRAALLDLFGPQGTKKAPGPTYGISKDVWAALALAETVRSGNYRPYVPVHLRTV